MALFLLLALPGCFALICSQLFLVGVGHPQWVWVGEAARGAAENTEERILRLNEKIFGLWRWLEGTRQWISQGCRYIFEQAPDQPLLTCCPIVLVFVYQYKDATWPSEPNQSYCLKVTPCLLYQCTHILKQMQVCDPDDMEDFGREEEEEYDSVGSSTSSDLGGGEEEGAAIGRKRTETTLRCDITRRKLTQNQTACHCIQEGRQNKTGILWSF